MIVSTTTNNSSLLTRNNTHRSHLRLLLWCSGPFRSTTRLILANQFQRCLLFRLLCYLSPACRCHANCLIIISDTFITVGHPPLPPSCPFITLIRFVWKISGFRYFPIHCHLSDRDKFGFYL